jgi:N-6 DNA Methylase
MAASALSVLPSGSARDLGIFVNRHHRLPRLGDAVAPWHYRGWMLAYIILIHERCPAVADRWGYYLGTLEAGQLLDEPIPQIVFGQADKRINSMLHDWSAFIGRDCGGWSDFRTLLDWLLWALALSKEGPSLSETVNEKLYRKVDLGPMLESPYDYLGDFVAQGRAKGWNPTAFFPTPHNVVELMVRMTMADNRESDCDPRTFSVNDPCVGSGRMLLHASNFSLNLFGQDIDPLAVAMCKINGALYAPWISFSLPASILGTVMPDPPSDDAPIFHIHDRGQRLLFDD